MNRRTRITLICVIVLLVAGMALYPSVRKKIAAKKAATATSAPAPKQGRPLNINAQILTKGPLSDAARGLGVLMPDEEVDLSFETSGKITAIYFKDGVYVKKGTLLAKVNDNILQAELKKLETQVPLAKDRVYRQGALLEKDAVSQEAFEQVTTELDKLNADIELVRARIAQTELRAPFDGMIGLRQVSEGMYATPSTVVVKLTKISPLKVDFSVNERYVNRIGPGTNITFTIQDDLNTYKASIYAVESKVDPETHSLQARATYPNPGGRLKPGMYAAINIKISEIHDALVLPNEAVIAEMGRDIVFLYKSGKAKQTVITKGLRTEVRVQALSGVSAGDTLITTGVMQLRDGMAVTIDNIE